MKKDHIIDPLGLAPKTGIIEQGVLADDIIKSEIEHEKWN